MHVFITQDLDPAAIELLEAEGHTVAIRRDPAPISRAELLAGVQGADALLCMLTDKVDAEVMDAGPLKVVANYAVGFDNLDRAAAAERGVVCTNTPGVLTDATADLAMALLLAAARMVVPGDRFVRDGKFVGWHPTLMRGLDLNGARLGILGMGRIGRATARRARAFGMELAHHRGNPQELPSTELGVDELIATSDVLSLHCPLTPHTRHLLNAARLRTMKPHAVLVNTARGPVVDEAALVQALSEGWIAAAGLDVYEGEPAVHPGLLELDNVVLLPHLGSATVGTRRKMALMAARNILAVLNGEEAPNAIPVP